MISRVIPWTVALAQVLAQSGASPRHTYSAPVLLGRFADPHIAESSGLAASRRNPGFFWTHNDGGDGPNVFLIDREAKTRGTWVLQGARNFDWEDIAIGPGPQKGASYLYIGDIGDNDRVRKTVTIYRALEPAADATPRTLRSESIIVAYPDKPHDAEGLLVHPATGDLYIVTKAKGSDSNTLVFKLPAPFKTTGITTLQLAATLHLPEESEFTLSIGRVTGAAISPDGRRVALCDYLRVYETELPAAAGSFDPIWKQPFTAIEFGRRQQGESICYRLDGKALLATSEGRGAPLLEIVRQ